MSLQGLMAMLFSSSARTTSHLFLAPLLLCLMSGCPAPSDDDEASLDSCLTLSPAAETTLVVGTGSSDTFQALTETTVFEEHHGFQGGSHLEIAVRLFNQDNNDWIFDFSLLNDSGLEIGSGSWFAPSCHQGWSESSGINLYLNDFGYDKGQLIVTATEQWVATPQSLEFSAPISILSRED